MVRHGDLPLEWWPARRHHLDVGPPGRPVVTILHHLELNAFHFSPILLSLPFDQRIAIFGNFGIHGKSSQKWIFLPVSGT
ncbi:hypothetical protein, partial [Streptomyces tateyamensis]|uniref:hypothetical protein n=1 Tax=Streptomyces tateyamensis TaxID=565073 RepID=UPI001C64A5D3